MYKELFQIKPLNHNTLTEATNLRDTYFGKLSINEQKLLKASLNPKDFQEVLENEAICFVKYWVLLDSTSQKVIGMIGLYIQTDFPDIIWLGWFVINKKYRKQKLGDRLLDFAINEAKKLNGKELHLYSWNSKMYQPALNLYEKYDFYYYTSKEKIYKKDIFMKKKL